jgi:hypothetical protein
MNNGVLTVIGSGATSEDGFDVMASSLKRGSRDLVTGSLRATLTAMIIKAPQVSSYQVFEINQPDKNTGELDFGSRVGLDSSSVTAGVSFAW